MLQVLLETIPDRIYFKDRDSRFVLNNQAHAVSLGVASPADCAGKNDFDFFSSEHAERAFADEQEIIRTGVPIVGKVERTTLRDGRTMAWVSTTKMPWRNAAGEIIGTFGLTRDITATKNAEQHLQEERNLLRTIVDLLPSRIFVKDRQARYVLNNTAHLKSLGAADQGAATGRTILDFHPGPRGEQGMEDDRQVLAGGPPILAQEKSDFGEKGDVHWALTTKVPLRSSAGLLTGLVGISHDITPQKLAELQLRQHAAEMELDVKMARQIQEVFLPRDCHAFPPGVPPEASALELSHRYLPAATLGGDFFDILPLSDTLCGILLCDVMGHGVRAGLITALIRGAMAEMKDRAESPELVMREINRSLVPILEQTGQPVFATAFYAVIDTSSGRITYSNAGHPPPFLVPRGREEFLRLGAKDPEPAAGLMPGFTYTRLEAEFQPGDLLLAYSDGLPECNDPRGVQFGEAAIARALATAREESVGEICAQLVRRLHSHAGSLTFQDDVCILAVRARGAVCTLDRLSYSI